MHNKEELENIVPSKAILKQIWEHSTHQGKILPSSRKPLGYVLGGQPGSGKSVLTETIKKNNKILLASMVTNTEVGILIFWNSEYIWQGQFKNHSKICWKVTEALIKKAIKEKYNVVIEGTFRTAETPLKTLKDLKENGYTTYACIKTCPADLTSCLPVQSIKNWILVKTNLILKDRLYPLNSYSKGFYSFSTIFMFLFLRSFFKSFHHDRRK